MKYENNIREEILTFAKSGVYELSDGELDFISGCGSWNGYDRNGCRELAENIEGFGSVFKQFFGL